MRSESRPICRVSWRSLSGATEDRNTLTGSDELSRVLKWQSSSGRPTATTA